VSQLAPAVVALVLYPGLVAVLAVGVVGDWADGRGFPDFRRFARRPPLTLLAAALLAALAAAQSGAPFNPVGSVDRNVLVAVIAVATAAGLGLDAGWGRRAPVLTLGLGAWTVALLVPAVLAQDVHPGVLASLAFGPAIVLKGGAAVVYLGGGATFVQAAGADVRRWLWFPVAGLFASVFVPAPGDDAAGLLEFSGATLAALAVLLALGLAIRRLPQLTTT
jgi:hypothetical protein